MEIVVNGRFLTQSVTGVQRYARELVQAFDTTLDARPDLKVTVISPRLSQPPPRWKNIILRQAGHLQGHAWEQLELPWLSRGRLLFCPCNTAPIASLFSSQQVVVTVHDLSYRYFPSAYSRAFQLWYGIVVPLALRLATAVITVSESERIAISRHYPAALPQLHAIQNGGLPVGFYTLASNKMKAGRRYGLYVGSLSKRKNFPGVLETASRLARKRGFDFVFVGGSAGGISENSVSIPNDVRSHLTFAGQIDDTTALIQYYRHATFFLFPSYYEASPLPPIEAMACGCPVIASDIPSLRERCGNAAIYCDPADINTITAAVERVMDNPDIRSDLQDLGRQHAAKYTWERCATQTLDIICAAKL